MIPIIFKRYKNSVLATCISLFSTAFYVVGGFMAVGYILDLENMRRDMSLAEALLAAAVFILIGFGAMKLAARVALNKEKKLVAEAAAQRQAARPQPTPQPAPERQTARPAGAYCPKCGTWHEAGDAFCARCGAKL